MKVKQRIEKIKNSIWVYPVFYSLLAFILASLVIVLDNGYFFNIRPYLPDLFLTSGSLAKSVLGIVSSAFINITTFTFSTTMVVLSIYMSQFSPRVVENFLSDKQTMKSFGIFVSGFIYSIVCMLFIREDVLNKPILAGTIGVIYIIIGLFNFIMFINSVGKHIQASNLIDRLYDQAKTDIQSYQETISTFESIKTEKMIHQQAPISIENKQSGYIQQIDFEGMFELAKKYKIDIRFNKVMGQFVTKHMPLGEFAVVSGQEDAEKVLDEIHQTLLIGKRRTEKQDFSFSIQKIVEVALKSLSPGINDPNTGIFCIRNLGMLLSQLSSLKDGYVVMEHETAKGKVYRESYDMDKMLKDSFLQIIHYGEADVYVMTAVMKAYRQILLEANADNKDVVFTHAEYLFHRLQKSSYDDLEKEMIIEVYKDIIQIKKGVYVKNELYESH